MTDENEMRNDLLRDQLFVLGAGLVAASAAGFTIGCFLTRLITDSVTAQFIVALLGAVLAPVVKWSLIQKNDSADDEKTLTDLWGGILITYGLAILLFPSACPAAADVFQQYIPSFFYYAVGISGAIAVCVFIGMMWLKVLKTYAGSENDGD